MNVAEKPTAWMRMRPRLQAQPRPLRAYGMFHLLFDAPDGIKIAVNFPLPAAA